VFVEATERKNTHQWLKEREHEIRTEKGAYTEMNYGLPQFIQDSVVKGLWVEG